MTFNRTSFLITAFIIVVCFFLVPQSTSAVSCHILFPPHAGLVPAGYGLPWDEAPGPGHDQLYMKADCGADVTFTVGNGTEYNRIYPYGYEWNGDEWLPFWWEGDNLGGDNWFYGEASVTRPLAPAGERRTFIALICSWDGFKWNCGCKDYNCNEPTWQAQTYMSIFTTERLFSLPNLSQGS